MSDKRYTVTATDGNWIPDFSAMTSDPNDASGPILQLRCECLPYSSNNVMIYCIWVHAQRPADDKFVTKLVGFMRSQGEIPASVQRWQIEIIFEPLTA